MSDHDNGSKGGTPRGVKMRMPGDILIDIPAVAGIRIVGQQAPHPLDRLQAEASACCYAMLQVLASQNAEIIRLLTNDAARKDWAELAADAPVTDVATPLPAHAP